MSRKKKLQKKIAVAVSVVNLLNMGAPMVLPYVNVAGRMPAAGGQIVQFADTAQSVLYGTAHAANYTVPPDSTVDVMNANDTMNVNNGGTGTVTTMTGGVQNVNSGGAGTVVTMSGGRQIINNGGTGTVTTMTGGEQIVSSGGTGTVSSLQSGGKQIVYNGGMAISTTIDNGGTQSVLSGGTAMDTTLKNKGKQIVSSGGVASGGTFSGVNTNTRGYQEVFEGGTVVGAIFSAYGNQTVTGGMARDTTVTSGGIQAITNKGVSLNATIMSGGTQSATEGGILAGTQTIEAGATASGGTLKEISVEGQTFKGVQNVNSGGTANNITVTGGGTQFVLNGGTANGVTLDGGTLSMAGGAIASGTVGGHGRVVYDGGSGQISLGGTNNFSSFTVSGGTLETQNGFHINSSGGITVNSGGTLIAGGAVTVHTSGSSLTVSGGGTFSATNISAENGGEVSMSGGVLQAAGDITVRHALTNAYGDICAGGALTVGAGATQPGSGEQLNLSAGKNINADGQVVSATNISAGGAIAAGSITAANVIAGGSISANANISADAISAGDTVSAGGNLTAGTLALSAVPASGAAVSAVGDVNVTDLNVSDFNPAQNTSGSLISAGGTVSAKTVNGKSLTAGGTVDTNVKQAQLKAGIDATFDSLSVSLAADQKTLTYDAHNTYKDIAFSTVTWNTGSAYYEAAASDRFNDNTSISAEKLSFTFAEESQKASLASGSTMTLFANATGLPAGMTVNYGSGRTSVAQSIEYKAPNGAALTGTLTGTAATTAEAGVGAVKYTAGSMTLDSVDLAGWDGTASSTVPDGWTAKNGTAVTVYTDNMKNLPTDIPAGGSRAILTAAAGSFFLDNSISGGNKYGTNPDRLFTETDTLQNAVVIKGTQDKGVKAADTGKSLVYAVGIKDVTAVSLGAVTWQKDAVLLDGSDKAYNYSAVASLDDGGFDVAFEDGVPETVAAGDSMTLLKANETLQDMAAVEKQKQYKVTRLSGDLAMYTVDAILTGNLTANSGRVAFTAAVNQATKLSFENVNWLDSGALIDHKTTLASVSFNGAAVDTSKINFINKQGLEANQQMTLVSDFGGKPGKITGTMYKVGTAFEGEGAAEMSGDDLIFKTKTGTGHVSDETHHAVMAAEAGMALLAAGSEHVGNVMNGIGLKDNAGSDGTSVAASLGGGAFHYETGSHVNSHTWNAVVAAGAKKELEKGTLQYGLFGEYGKGNYTLHSKAGRGDGDAHYAGGGLLAKWTNKHSVYAEASIRQGRMSDTASDILHDAAGNGYGYNVHANYFGVHLGLGKVFKYNSGRSLDVYGKYFYTKRNGVSFEAGTDHYDLDSVASNILRIGARYGSTDKKWNWYGGLAYEYEFDGEANGTVNGRAIRSASVKGSSIRSEIGLRMDASRDNPWKADIAIYGYGGKHRGFGGSVNVAYTF